MTDETPSIFDTDIYEQKKSRFYPVLVILFSTYLLFIFASFLLDSWGNLLSMTVGDWAIILLLTFIPSFSFFLFTRKKQIGWLFCLTYNMLVATGVATDSIKELAGSKNMDYSRLLNWRADLFILLTISPVVLLLSKDIRKYFRIDLIWLSLSLVASIGLSGLFAFAIMLG